MHEGITWIAVVVTEGIGGLLGNCIWIIKQFDPKKWFRGVFFLWVVFYIEILITT